MEWLLFALRLLMAAVLLGFIAATARQVWRDRVTPTSGAPFAPLSITRLDTPDRRYAIAAGQAWIGRDPNCLIHIDDEFVSQRHARVFWEAAENTWMLEDSGSRNGTLVNGVRITRTRLRSQDVVKTGGIEMRVM